MVITADDLKLETQIVRCKMGIHEYFKEQCIRIDYEALYKKLDPPSLLFQFSHMIAFHKMNWKDALMWVMNNRATVLAYANGEVDEWGNLKVEQARSATSQAD